MTSKATKNAILHTTPYCCLLTYCKVCVGLALNLYRTSILFSENVKGREVKNSMQNMKLIS